MQILHFPRLLLIALLLLGGLLQWQCRSHKPPKANTTGNNKNNAPKKLPIGDAKMSDFEEKVLKSSKLVVVDFWTDWCAPCKSLIPVMEELAYEYRDQTVFYRINAEKDDNIYLTIDYEVKGYPTILYFKDGKNISRQTGAILKEMIGQHIAGLLHANPTANSPAPPKD